MTAVNVFLYSDAAVVMTDGLAAAADGSGRCVKHKVLPLAHLHAVVAVRGPVFVLGGITDMLSRHASFDAAREAMADDLRMLVEDLRRRLPIPAAPDGPQLHLIGKSEASGGFESWICAADDHPGLTAFDARRTKTMMLPDVAGCDAHTQRLAARASAEDGGFDPDTDGVQLMRGQMRAYPLAVGGYCQITVVNSEGITTRILERWP